MQYWLGQRIGEDLSGSEDAKEGEIAQAERSSTGWGKMNPKR